MNDKRLTHKEALLQLLSDYKKHTMRECQNAGGWRYGGRLHELRREGYIIDTIREGTDVYSYQMVPNVKQGVLL